MSQETYFGFPQDKEFTPAREPHAILIHCLRLAATHYDDYAEKASKAGLRETAVRLMSQAAQTRELADRLEDARYVRVGREVE